MIEYKNILFCTDFSEDADIAFVHACDLAKRYNAKLTILHVLHSLHRYSPTETREGQPHGEVGDVTPELIEQVTQDVKKRYAKGVQDIKGVTYRVMAGTPYVEILRHCRDNPVDIIVMGAFGTSAVEQLHYGSTVEQVSKRAPCHIMAIRNPERVYTL